MRGPGKFLDKESPIQAVSEFFDRCGPYAGLRAELLDWPSFRPKIRPYILASAQNPAI